MRVRASGSFRRYHVDPRGGRDPEVGSGNGNGAATGGLLERLRNDPALLAKRLHAQRFRSIDHAGSEVSSAGWCRSEGTVPREFDADEHWLGPVLGVPLRIDRKRLPPGALRVRRMEAEAAERRAVGERIAPARRREIADKIEAELVARMVPATAIHTMLWHSGRGEVLLDATADPANVTFRALFRETFGATPDPLVTATLAERLAPAGGRGAARGRAEGKGGSRLAELAPAAFTSGGVAIVGESPGFLGRELLLWLWHACETAGGKLELGELGEVGVAFDQLLELGGASGDGRVTVRGDAPTRAPEAASALLSGRLPLRARLLLARGEATFGVTLTADTLDLEAVKVDAESVEITDENLRAGDEQRAQWLFELAALVDALFAEFLKLRVSSAFDADVVPAIRTWISRRSHPRARAATA